MQALIFYFRLTIVVFRYQYIIQYLYIFTNKYNKSYRHLNGRLAHGYKCSYQMVDIDSLVCDYDCNSYIFKIVSSDNIDEIIDELARFNLSSYWW